MYNRKDKSCSKLERIAHMVGKNIVALGLGLFIGYTTANFVTQERKNYSVQILPPKIVSKLPSRNKKRFEQAKEELDIVIDRYRLNYQLLKEIEDTDKYRCLEKKEKELESIRSDIEVLKIYNSRYKEDLILKEYGIKELKKIKKDFNAIICSNNNQTI